MMDDDGFGESWVSTYGSIETTEEINMDEQDKTKEEIESGTNVIYCWTNPAVG